MLISGRGEASGVAIARELLDRYAQLDAEDRLHVLPLSRDRTAPRRGSGRCRGAGLSRRTRRRHARARCKRRSTARGSNSSAASTWRPAPPPRSSPCAATCLRVPLEDDPALAAVDADLRRLLYAWFNRGFLVLRRIDWNTPAAILEKIIRYEAVHEIQGWDDLRRRLDPADRRCFAFFHPSLVDEPLVFVEVALMRDIPDAIGEVLEEPHDRVRRPSRRPRPCSIRSPIARTVCGHLVRQLPVQAGRRGARARGAAPQDLCHALAGAAVCGVDGAGRRGPRSGRAGSDLGAGAHDPGGRVRPRAIRAGRGGRSRAGANRGCWRSPPITSSRPSAATAARSTRLLASISAMGRGSSASTGWRIPRPRACARPSD